MKTASRRAAVFLLAVASCSRGSITELRHPDPTVRCEAILHVISAKQIGQHLCSICLLLDDEDVRVRRRAALALNQFGSSGRITILARLSDEKPRVRAAVLLSLSTPDPRYIRAFTADDDTVFFDYVVLACRDTSDIVRQNACAALADVCIGAGRVAEGVEHLTEALGDSAAIVRASAAHSIGWVARETSRRRNPFTRTILPLALRLSDQDREVQARSAWALKMIGGQADAAIPFLISAISNNIELTANADVESALAEVGAENAEMVMKPMAAAFQQTKSGLNRLALLRVLRRMKNKPDSCVPLLKQAIYDDDQAVRNLAFIVLAEMGIQTEQGDPALKGSLRKH